MGPLWLERKNVVRDNRLADRPARFNGAALVGAEEPVIESRTQAA